MCIEVDRGAHAAIFAVERMAIARSRAAGDSCRDGLAEAEGGGRHGTLAAGVTGAS